MAYMHSQTFDIIYNSNIDGYLDDYFEIDDYIAKPVQILNLKGYKTRFCCSGHPYDTVNELTKSRRKAPCFSYGDTSRPF